MTARTPPIACKWPPSCTSSLKPRCCPAPAWPAPHSGKALTPSWPTWRPRTSPCWPSATACKPSWTPGTGQPRPDQGHGQDLPQVPGKDWLPGARARQGEGHDQKRGRRAGHAGRPAAGGAHPERPLRAERRQRALGQPVRRAVRHRRDLRSRRLRERPGLQRKRGAKVIEYARHVLDRTAPLAKQGSHVDSTGYAVVGGKLVVTLKAARPPG
jgi:hypothetical protein